MNTCTVADTVKSYMFLLQYLNTHYINVAAHRITLYNITTLATMYEYILS